MAIAISPRDEIEYVLRDERKLPVEQQTIWLLKPLTAHQRYRLKDVMEGGAKVGSAHLAAMRAGLRGWRNFRDESGAEAPFEKESHVSDVLGRKVHAPTMDTLGLIPADAENELVEAIVASNALTVDDAKN